MSGEARMTDRHRGSRDYRYHPARTPRHTRHAFAEPGREQDETGRLDNLAMAVRPHSQTLTTRKNSLRHTWCGRMEGRWRSLRRGVPYQYVSSTSTTALATCTLELNIGFAHTLRFLIKSSSALLLSYHISCTFFTNLYHLHLIIVALMSLFQPLLSHSTLHCT